MKTMIKSPLRYPGGKSRAISQIEKQLPPNFKENFSEYREPFVGGGSVFIYLKQKYPNLKAWINDLNPEVYLFWKICRSNLKELVNEVRNIKNNYQDGRSLFTEMSQIDVNNLSELERAVRFFVLNRITFSGTIEAGGYSSKSFESRFTYSSIDRLQQLEIVLDDQVKITNLDYRDLLKPMNEEVFIFLDPPYYAATKSKLYGKRGDLHTNFDHKTFAKNLNQCPHKWLITYDNSEEIKDNFKNANIEEWELQYGMNNYQQKKVAKGQEIFISNYQIKQHKSEEQLSLNLF
jgi:DNA adenine methylase